MAWPEIRKKRVIVFIVRSCIFEEGLELGNSRINQKRRTSRGLFASNVQNLDKLIGDGQSSRQNFLQNFGTLENLGLELFIGP